MSFEILNEINLYLLKKKYIINQLYNSIHLYILIVNILYFRY